MELRDKLLSENLDPVKLEKGLKHIGLNLSRFNDFQEEHVPDIIHLFKLAVEIDYSSSRLMKMDVRAKLE
jgi:hypothetical protein